MTLGAFADDDRVVDLVCEPAPCHKQLVSSDAYQYASHRPILESSYSVGSLQNRRVAEAVEELVDQRDGSRPILDYALPGLAAVDRGPKMKKLLLDRLADSPLPYWAASALAEHFSDDAEVRAALRAALMDDPAACINGSDNRNEECCQPRRSLPRLLAILRELKETPGAGSARHDIVAAALVQAKASTRH